MARKKYIWGGHTYLIADEDLKLYPGAKPAEDKKKEVDAAAKAAEEPAEDEKKEADAAAKAAEEPKNKARKSVKNKTKVEE